ncbi:hypothetical protein DRO37_02485 [Candidatus Bathyarchaeota archaeon]|nr:MAG: hypothetical protein DRO37_02485 [Candidatus Bathyarchaeota archaeon]
MKATISLFRWELSSITRLKIVLPLVAFMFFTSALRPIESGMTEFSGMNIPFGWLARQISWGSIRSLGNIYLALAFFSAVLASASFAGEIDSGLLKFYLSLPLSRLKVFTSKFLAGYMLLFLSGLAATCYSAIMEAAEGLLIIIPRSPIIYLLDPALFLAQELLFTFSVSIYFSVVSRRAWQSSLYSILTLYSFYTIAQINPRLRWFFPPDIFSIAFSRMIHLYIVFYTLLSIALLCLSCYLFVRRLEVA